MRRATSMRGSSTGLIVQYLTVHYHELALKGGNRPRFERALRENLKAALRGSGVVGVRSIAGRILVEVEDGAAETALERVLRVFGVAHAMRVVRLPREPAAVGDAVIAELARGGAGTFRICTRRVDKRYPMTSVDLDRAIGARVHEATGVPVRLKGAALEAHVVWLDGEALLGVEKRGGPGGLPVGTGGRVAALMSGGIDSPVAAWRLMKRGCRVDLVHFHSHPLVDRTTQEKARDLAAVLTPWQFQTRLHLVPLAEIQKEIRLKSPEALRVILYRRFMVRIAERISSGSRGAAASRITSAESASSEPTSAGLRKRVAALLVIGIILPGLRRTSTAQAAMQSSAVNWSPPCTICGKPICVARGR